MIETRYKALGELSNRVAFLEETNARLSSSLAAASSGRQEALLLAQQAKQEADAVREELKSTQRNADSSRDWQHHKKLLEEEVMNMRSVISRQKVPCVCGLFLLTFQLASPLAPMLRQDRQTMQGMVMHSRTPSPEV